MDNLIAVDFKSLVKIKSNDRVSLRDIWEELGLKRQFTNWAQDYLPLFEENQEFGILLNKKVKQDSPRHGGSNRTDFWVTVAIAKEICMLSHTDKGRAIRKYFIDCERLVEEHGLQHKLSSPVPHAMSADYLQEMVNNYRQLEIERNLAIKTKAEIGSKREATAMATASNALRKLQLVTAENEELRLKLGENADLKRAVAWTKEFPILMQKHKDPSHLGVACRKKAKAMNLLPFATTPDQKHGTVNLVPRAVIEAIVADLTKI